jgi:hypothetical protein
MAGQRKFSLKAVDRSDIAAANRETARETGLGFITDIGDERAREILKKRF